jgi:PAS domain S-box-containing protein
MRCRSLKGTMKDKRIIFTLIIIMSFIAMGGISITLFSLYQAAFGQQSGRLRDTVQSRARIIESIARHTVEHYRLEHANTVALEETAFKETLLQIIQAHGHFKGFGKTGEFTLAKREGDKIVFLLSHRHNDLENLKSVPISSEYAEPMRRALSGKSGTLVGLDYRGEIVLAGYEPVGVYGLGIVAKIDLAEIRAPFIKAATISIVLSFLLIFVGTFLFLRIGNPIIKRLTASEEKHRTYVKNAPEGIFIADAAGKYTDVNEAACRMTGYSRGELLNMTIPELTSPEASPGSLESFAKLHETGAVQTEAILRRKDGSDFPVSLKAVVLAENLFMAFCSDITDRKQAEEALRESEGKFRTLSDQALMGIIILQEELFVYVNDRATEIMEVPAEEVANWSLGDYAKLIHPDDLAFVMEQGRKKQAGEKDTVIHYNWRMVTPGGNLKWIEMWSKTIPFANRTADMVTMIDITNRKQVEEALNKEKNRMQMYLDIAGVILLVLDQNGDIILVNKRGCEVLGYSESEMLGMNWFDRCLPAKNRSMVRGVFNQLMQGEVEPVEYFENTAINKNGEKRLIAWHNTLLRNDEGIIVGTLSSGEDITERKHTEKELQESEARFRDISENMADWIWEANAEGIYTYASGKVEQVLGYSIDEMLGKTPFDFMHPDEARRVGAEFAKIVASKQIIQDLENWNQTKDGRLVCLLTNGIPLLDEQGELLGYRGVDRDITERKRAEEELRNSEKWLSTTLNSVGDAVITTDVEGAVSFLNPTAQALTGWKLEDALGRPLTTVFNIINERTRETVENPATKVLRENKVVGLANHTVLISKDGVERPIADSGAPIEDDEGNVLGVVLVFRDMSEAREMEAQNQQRQKLEAIGTLAGGVAHEINNPVGIIMNNAELMLDDVEPGGDLEINTREIIRESKRIATIVKNLLSFSRREKESHSPALIADIVESTLSLTRKVLANNQITIEVDIPDDLPQLRCRSQQIQQVLMNLFANARYALNQRYPKYDKNKVIKITAQTFTRNDIVRIRVSVEDHGAGISPEIIGRIFDPFFTTKPRDEGTGLGLSISHGIAREHQGELRVESQEGQYTRFHLELRVDNGWSLSQSGTDVKEND